MSFPFPDWSYNVTTLQVVPEQNEVRAARSTKPVDETVPMSFSCWSESRSALKRGPV